LPSPTSITPPVTPPSPVLRSRPRERMMRPWPALAVATAAVAGLLVGCGSSTTSGSGTPAPTTSETPAPTTSETPAVCTQADVLVSSVHQLADIDVIKQGTSSLNTAVQNVQTQVQALSQSASEQFKPQVDALQSAINNLQSVLNNLGSSPNLVHAAGQIASAVTQLTTATQDLVSTLSSTCPGGVATVAPTTSVSPS